MECVKIIKKCRFPTCSGIFDDTGFAPLCYHGYMLNSNTFFPYLLIHVDKYIGHQYLWLTLKTLIFLFYHTYLFIISIFVIVLFSFLLSAKLDLCIERPLKVNLSTTKLDQMISFYDTLSRTMYPDKQTDGKLSQTMYPDKQTDGKLS